MEALLTHPSAKFPFLVANLICGRICSLPPTPPPKQDEKNRYEADKRTRDLIKDWASWYTPLRRRTMHAVTIAEILLILARSNPSILNNPSLAFFTPLLNNPVLSRLRITRTFLVGSLLIYAATAIRLLCYRTLGRHFTFQLAILPQHKLITAGPYSVVRHPAYTASVIFNFAVVLCQLGRGSWLKEVVMSRAGASVGWGVAWGLAVSATSYLLVSRIPKEDMVLKREFGEQWDKWAEKTKYRLIPGIY
ncbi:hypothetical protein EIP91_009122 [Steccherinum ochraceum]|uniref:Protein-S-isoprenylcysteine O-methyltransferase n=1 Tax=Steccherinum ochraceum TaxID=92696 RepID=A0A4R0RA76_9APHY|nr:hypothetical protein EIP91_009122 [Steccherinum ochraceum]